MKEYWSIDLLISIHASPFKIAKQYTYYKYNKKYSYKSLTPFPKQTKGAGQKKLAFLMDVSAKPTPSC